MWDIVSKYGDSLRKNSDSLPDIMGGIAKTIKRGVKSLDDLDDYAKRIGATFLTKDRIEHILRGEGWN